MLINTTSTAAFNTRTGLSITQGALPSASTLLSSSVRDRLASGAAASTSALAAQQAAARAALANTNSTVARAQIVEGTLDQADAVLRTMSEVVAQAGSSIYTAADRESMNKELSGLKDSLKQLAGAAGSDVLSKSYESANGNSYSLTGAQGSRDISVSASTTAADVADMLSALGKVQEGVSSARASNGAAMANAFQSQTEALTQSASDSGLNVREISVGNTSEALDRASSAAERLAAGRLAIMNAMGNSNSLVFSLLR